MSPKQSLSYTECAGDQLSTYSLNGIQIFADFYRIGASTTLETETRKYRVTQAYLEMARAFLHCKVIPGENQKTREMPNELVYAICASNFQNAYLAVSSFLISQIGACYKSNLRFRNSFKNHDFETVSRKELQDLPGMLKALSRGLQVRPLHEKSPRLHQQLNELVKEHRHFLTHPSPSSFGKKVSEITEKIEWGFPVLVAQDVIRYFYEETNTSLPDWLVGDSNLFRIPTIEVFDTFETHPQLPLSQQPSRYRRHSNAGEVIDFQFDNNNGSFVLGSEEVQVTMQFSKAGPNTVHVYSDRSSSVRIAVQETNIENIGDPRSYDGSSRVRTARVGDIVLWENQKGRFFAIKLTAIQYPYLSFDYQLLDEIPQWVN